MNKKIKKSQCGMIFHIEEVYKDVPFMRRLNLLLAKLGFTVPSCLLGLANCGLRCCLNS